jgi:hypothetical protein
MVQDLSDDDMTLLLNQKSFAGTLHFSWGDTTESHEALAHDVILAQLAQTSASSAALPLCTCVWQRDIDFRPPTGGLDIGVCAAGPAHSDGSVDMRETGADASYAEGWHRLSGSEQGPVWACQLVHENGVNRPGFWIRTGPFFAYAIGRPNDEESARTLHCTIQSSHVQACVGKTLDEAVQEAGWGLDVVGSYVAVWGVVTTTTTTTAPDDDSGPPSTRTVWNIHHSTDPSLVGCELFGPGTFSCSTLTLDDDTGSSSTEFSTGSIFTQKVGSHNDGGDDDDDECIRTWKVIEISDTSIMKEELFAGQS